MRWTKWICLAALVLVVAQSVAFAKEGARPYQLNNRLRVEWDDNIYQTEDDKTSGMKVIEEVEFLVNFNLENTFVSLRYRPSVVWWENRSSDHWDFNNDVDFIFNHAFTPRLNMSLTDTLRRGELPELVDGNVIVREEDDFYYNSANLVLGYILRPETRIDLAGRNTLLRYDDSVTSENEDYIIWAGGATLRHRVHPKTTGLGELRYEHVTYDGADRGSKSVYAALGVEQTFSPSLLGNLRGGYQRKMFNDDDLSSENAPYGDIALTFLPSPATRLTGGAKYSLFEANVYPYADQKQLQTYLSLAYDITARVAFYLSGSYSRGQYDGEYSVDPTVRNVDGTENVYQASARASYKVARNNWLEAGYQYVDFDSDLRVSYKRNRFDLGWKIQL